MFEHFKNEEIRGYGIEANGKYVKVDDNVSLITYDNYSKLPNHALYSVMSSANHMNTDYIHFQHEFGNESDLEYESEEERKEYEQAVLVHKSMIVKNYFSDTFGGSEMVIYRDDEYMYRILLGNSSDRPDKFRQFISLCGSGLDPADAYQFIVM